MEKKHLVVLTGAGMSAESGIATFRGGDGLWENHRIEDVATPGAWKKDPELVLRFYNERRTKIGQAKPNRGHELLAQLQDRYKLTVITQNIDDLHERSGVHQVLHLHGEITKVRSSLDPSLIYDIGYRELRLGEKCERGSQLRPHIVWFGEAVPMMDVADELASTADLFMVIGTSLQVYPAANLIYSVSHTIPKIIIDPLIPHTASSQSWIKIEKGGSEGMADLIDMIDRGVIA